MAHAVESWTWRKYAWLFTLAGASAYLHLLVNVSPRLIFQNQQPVFFSGAEFFQKHVAYPGGIAGYLSSMLEQLYLFPFLGALVMTLIIAGITLTAFYVYHTFKLGIATPYITLILTGTLLAVHSGYFYQLSYSLSVLFSLIAFLIFFYIGRKRIFLRLLLYLILCPILYYLVAAPFFIFVFLALFAEAFLTTAKWLGKLALIVIYISIALLWPLIAHAYLFLYASSDIYSFLLPFYLFLPIKVLPEFLYLLLLVPPFVSGVLYCLRKKNPNANREHKLIGVAKQAALLIVCLLALLAIVYKSFNNKQKAVLNIDKLAEEHKWENIIATAKAHPHVLHRLLTFHYNRALYHRGQLCEDLFAYPQVEGENGLYRNSGAAFEAPYAMASLTYEMGNINSAQCWANEALSIEGESARVLKLLTLIHLRKGEDDAAALYSNKLSKMLFQHKMCERDKPWTDELAKIKGASEASAVDSSFVASHFLIRYGHAYAELQYFIKRYPQHKMAFEYTMAYDLLSRRLDRLVEMVPKFMQMPFDKMPRHLEEALILIGMSGIDYNIDLNALNFRVDYVEKFRRFMSIISRHNNNTQFAQAELLQEFGDTYWYYHLYHQPQELK
ncbi:hypothetical protein JXA70_03235 [candidate division KSB1 bacterium]|nr:hypothetical protein [candidate division KSB1 bacterium]